MTLYQFMTMIVISYVWIVITAIAINSILHPPKVNPIQIPDAPSIINDPKEFVSRVNAMMAHINKDTK